MKTIKIITVKFDTTISSDLIAYHNLSENGKSVFNLFNKFAHVHDRKLLTLDITELSNILSISEAEFINAVNEITAQEYFMYYVPNEDKFVFANSRMVF